VAACVAAASVIAKVTRDRIMRELDADWPQYGFAEHKGYSTPEHTAAMYVHGVTPHHRMSYANVAAVVGGTRPRGGAGEIGADAAGLIGEDANVAGGMDGDPCRSSVGVSPAVVSGVASPGDGAPSGPMGENSGDTQSSAQESRG